MKRSSIVVLLACAPALVACKKKVARRTSSATAEAAPGKAPAVVEGTATRLPETEASGAIGVAGPADFVRAADDGSWVMLCQDDKLHVVVGAGPGLVADRAVAATDHDIVVVDGDALVHVDVVARTARRLGPIGPVAIDAASRRLVQADGARIIVRDPGVAPRTFDAPAKAAGIWLRGRRWLEVAPGDDLPYDLRRGSCGWAGDESYELSADGRATIDLDPSGVEAMDRIGPELGITGTGEITLDGDRVLGAECVGEVIAALATPPRALVACNDGYHLVGPGLDRKLGGMAGVREQAGISEHLALGRRVICVQGACIDLVGARDYATWDAPAVWADERFLVRKDDAGLVIDDLDQPRQRTVALPRLTQAVTVDTATGRRRAGAAPKPPSYVDAAGDYLLYGRHVVDVSNATLVGTLGEEALAVDWAGRALVPAADDTGPLRWKRP